MRAKGPAVFLDRDGVLNEAIIRDGLPYPPKSWRDLRLTPGARKSLLKLTRLAVPLLVVTNQPDIARGQTTLENVDALNRRLADRLPIDHFYICPHDGSANCECRKPKPGLLLQAARDYDVNLRSSFMIGDRWRDIDAGFAAGCRTIWIDRGYRERGPEHPPDRIVASLPEAVDWILAQCVVHLERSIDSD